MPSFTPMTGEMIGDYKVIDQIGAGGMAKVYLGVHKNVPNLKVILKVLEDPQLSERFTQEADKLAVLDGHPSICRIKHFFSVGDQTAIVMEYIDGQSLEEAIQEREKLSPTEAAGIICTVLETLQFAHDKGISHRDIKPNNIMINKQGDVKIIDFGIAKAQDDPQLTMAGTACGTPRYMSPEQFNPPPDTDYALADIYAVGTTLYRMVCGELPFKGDNPFVLRDAKLTTDPAKPRSLDKSIPKELEEIIMKAISRLPGDRFGSAAEMKAALARTIDRDALPPSESTMAVRGADSHTPSPPPATGKRAWSTAAGALVIMLAVVAYFIWFEGSQTDITPTVDTKPITLLWPINGTLIADTRIPQLTWKKVAGFRGSFMVEYATDTVFSDMRRFMAGADTSFTILEELMDGEYFWRVSYQGEELIRSGLGSFSIQIPGAGTDPDPVAPIATGQLTIRSGLPADIYINGKLVVRDRSEYTAEYNEGSYAIAAVCGESVEGRLDKSTFVRQGRPAVVDFRFTKPTTTASTGTGGQSGTGNEPPAPPPSQPTRAKLLVASYPFGATIFVDGELQPDVSTPHDLTVLTGRREIKVILSGDGGGTKTASIDVKAGKENKVMFNFEEDKILYDF